MFLIIKRITRSAIIVEINTKDVKLVKNYYFVFTFQKTFTFTSGYSLYNKVVCPK